MIQRSVQGCLFLKILLLKNKDILKLLLVKMTSLLTSVDYQRELADFLKQLKCAGIPVRDLLHFYIVIGDRSAHHGRSVIYNCLVGTRIISAQL